MAPRLQHRIKPRIRPGRLSPAIVLIAILVTACTGDSDTGNRRLVPADPIARRMTYIPFPMAIELDGDLSDWDGAPFNTVDSGKHFADSPTNNGVMSFALAANAGNLYVTMTMPDEEIVTGGSGEEFWLQDSFEFFMNFSGNLLAEEYNTQVAQFIVSPGSLDSDLADVQISGQNLPFNTEAVVFETDDGWGFEARIPLFGTLEPRHGGFIGFQAYGNGASIWGRNSHLIWSEVDTDGDAWQRPDVFGQAIFYEIGRDDAPQPIMPSIDGLTPGSWGNIVSNTWLGYRNRYIFCGPQCGYNLGLVFDPASEYLAVSEGIGYGLLSAVMMNDQYTFDIIYDASHKILFDASNSLFHWRADNTGGITDVYAATDADQDIAMALIFADERVRRKDWDESPSRPYGQRARETLDAIYAIHVNGDAQLKPGTLAGFDGVNLMNPSYFSPAWYRLYDQFEGKGRWAPVISAGYQTLGANPGASLGLAPDWMSQSGEAALEHCERMRLLLENCQYTMGYDAIRVPWRVGLDCIWFEDERACDWSRRSIDFFRTLEPELIARMYDLDGTPIVDYQDEAMIAMWYFAARAAGTLCSKPAWPNRCEPLATLRETDTGGSTNDYITTRVSRGLRLHSCRAISQISSRSEQCP